MKEKNIWKMSFFVLLVVFLITTMILIFNNVTAGIANSYQIEGYNMTEKDLVIFKNASVGMLSKNNILKSLKASKDDISLEYNMRGDHLILQRTTVYFDKNNKIEKYVDWGSEE